MTLHERLRAMAHEVCGRSMTERVIDPALTDIEIEYRTAFAANQRWRSRWIRIAGTFALAKVIALCAYDRTAHGWRPDDQRMLARTVAISAIALAGTVLLLITLPARRTSGVLLYLIPQALPIAIPAAVTWGILCGLGGRRVASRVKIAILTELPVAAVVWLPNLACVAAATALMAAAARRPSLPSS